MSPLMNNGLLAAVLTASLFAPGMADAQVRKELHDEYSKQIKTAETIGALGNDLFGEQVNFYTGSTSFAVTDVSLRGNSALPVEVRRSFKVESRDGLLSSGLFGDWELDIRSCHPEALLSMAVRLLAVR